MLRAFILSYGIRVCALQRLLRKEMPFEWGQKQIKCMKLIKDGARQAKAIRPLDYKDQGDIALAVDTSYIVIGFYIYQEDKLVSKKHYFAKFGSKPLNDQVA